MQETLARIGAARLYAIIDLAYVAPDAAGEMAAALVSGGAGVVQVRAKHSADAEIVGVARAVAARISACGVPLVLNDRPDLAAAAGADAVHVGQDDVSVAEARDLSGGLPVGKSTHSFGQAVAAQAEGADYIGYGPLFATQTKPDYVPVGLGGIAAVHGAVRVPIFCIGGIKRENLRDVLAAGARRAVIVSGLLLAGDPEACARDCVRLMGGAASVGSQTA